MSDSERLINLLYELRAKYQIPPLEFEKVFALIGLIRIQEVKQ